MTPRPARSLPAIGTLALAATLLPAAAASAHVTVDPPGAAAGQLVQLTFTVPNEQPDQATTGLDVALPKGFLLEAAQTVPGWTTTVDTAPDKTPIAVHWTGGKSAPKTYVTFGLRGRMPSGGSTAVFPAVQRYERTRTEWTKPDQTTDLPAPVVTLQPDLKGLDGSALGQTPGPGTGATAGRAGTSAGADALARSRSSLAVALGLGSLLLALGSLGATLLLRREGRAVGAGGPDPVREASGAELAEPAAKNPAKSRPPARSGPGKRR